jgi:transposase
MSRDPKGQALQAEGSLNPRPEAVTDALFRKDPFFDPRDLVQVKYEMLRRVQSEGQSVTHAAAVFGFSRPSFYQALSGFQKRGLAGLVPRKRGPKEAHKLTAEVIQFVRESRATDPGLRLPELVRLIARHFGVTVHPRSLERALSRSQKKRL